MGNIGSSKEKGTFKYKRRRALLQWVLSYMPCIKYFGISF